MQHGSLQNHIYAAARPANDPKVGDGATMIYWTDRHAATIVDVRFTLDGRPKEVRVQRDRALRADNFGMSDAQAYAYERDPAAPLEVFTRRRDGRWIRKGETSRDGTALMIGHRAEYYDFSF